MPKGKSGLLLWCQKKIEGYPYYLKITDFTTSWQDGLAFCALIHKHKPTALAYKSLKKNDRDKVIEIAFNRALDLGIPKILTKQDLYEGNEELIIQYLSKFYWVFNSRTFVEANRRKLESIMVENDGLKRSSQIANRFSTKDEAEDSKLVPNQPPVEAPVHKSRTRTIGPVEMPDKQLEKSNGHDEPSDDEPSPTQSKQSTDTSSANTPTFMEVKEEEKKREEKKPEEQKQQEEEEKPKEVEEEILLVDIDPKKMEVQPFIKSENVQTDTELYSFTVEVPVINAYKVLEFLSTALVDSMMERIRSEFEVKLKSIDTSKFEIGVTSLEKPDQITFLPPNERLEDCILQHKKSVIAFVDRSEFTRNASGFSSPVNDDPLPVALEGFLLKEGKNTLTKVKMWKRRWFCTQENRLLYYANRGGDDAIGVVTLSSDMQILPTPTPNNPRLFEMRTPTRVYRLEVGRSRALISKAMCADDIDLWVGGLQAITRFYKDHQAVIQIHMQGILMKRGGPLKAWKKRFCVLRTDCQWQLKTKQSSILQATVDILSALYYYTGENQQLKGKIPLLHTCIFDLITGIDRPYAFQIMSGSKKYIVAAPNEREKEQWVRSLREQIKQVGVDVDSIVYD